MTRPAGRLSRKLSPYLTPRYAISLLWRLPLGLLTGLVLGALCGAAVPVLGAIAGFAFGLCVCLQADEPGPPGPRPAPAGRRPRSRAPDGETRRVDIDPEDAELLLSLCEPGSTLEQPAITEGNYRRFVLAQSDAERQRRFAHERAGEES